MGKGRKIQSAERADPLKRVVSVEKAAWEDSFVNNRGEVSRLERA
jgi:hypothetical protein